MVISLLGGGDENVRKVGGVVDHGERRSGAGGEVSSRRRIDMVMGERDAKLGDWSGS